MLPTFFRCLCDDSGQGVVEYAMIVALVATGALAALHAVGDKLSTLGSAFDPFSPTAQTNVHVTIENDCAWHLNEAQSKCAFLHQ